MTPTPEKLAELRRLHEAATPGEWIPERMYVNGKSFGCMGVRVDGVEGHYEFARGAFTQTICQTIYGQRVDDESQQTKNMELIAAARNALPELLDEIERLRAENEQLLTNDQCAFGALVEASERLAERDKLRAAMERIQHLATLQVLAEVPGFDRISEMAREVAELAGRQL